MNLSIPDAAVELRVSETRLRKTIAQIAVPTHIEFRQTRTGVRKITMIGPDGVGQLRAHFDAPLPCGQTAPKLEDVAAILATDEELNEDVTGSIRTMDLAVTSTSHLFDMVDSLSQLSPESPVESASTVQTVPLTQFHALLYQHNVLREELTRVSEYLEGCDRLLGEMVRTISTLEERTRQLEPSRARVSRQGNPLTSALKSVSEGVQSALFARSPAAPLLKPAEVYYANVLTGR